MHIALFIFILAVLILVHEFGHFIMAKRAGIRVDEFGIGFPPRLWKFRRGETAYSINAIPFGGFVKIFGEDNESLLQDNGGDTSRSFVRARKMTQVAIIGAGVAANLFLAWILFSAIYLIGAPLSVSSILPNSPAAEAGMRAGDHLRSMSVGENTITNLTPESIQVFTAQHPGEKINVTLSRAGILSSLTVVPEKGLIDEDKNRAAIGINMDFVQALPLHLAFFEGFKTTINWLYGTGEALTDLFIGLFSGTTSFSSLSGPVGIAGLVGDAASLGLVYVLSLAAIISVNLSIMNIIPFPALDGGRLLFILVETVTRRSISPKIAGTLNVTGFALLMLLMVLITYHDIAKIIIGS